jgi:hypothetical protein
MDGAVDLAVTAAPLAVGSSPSRPTRTLRRVREPRLPTIPYLRVLLACIALYVSGEVPDEPLPCGTDPTHFT